MCTFPAISGHGNKNDNGGTTGFLHNAFRWNFQPLTLGYKSTIEFRQPPGSVNAVDAKLWVQFANSFIQGAIQYADVLDPFLPPTLELLDSLVLNGAHLSGVKDLRLLRSLFLGKTHLPVGAYEVNDSVEEEQMRGVRNERDVRGVKLKLLFGCR